jgi:hypothetical protein
MLKRQMLAAAIAALGLAGGALAQTAADNDVRQEDRRADRQEDRQADRQQEPREMELENENQNQNARDARFAVPRKADGTIDLQALDAEIRAALAGGARDVRIRDRDLTAMERQQLADLARQIGTDLNLDRVRVRQDGGRLRIDLRPERTARAERPERQQRVERVDRPERAERAERPERVERVERVERPERSGHQ